MLQILPVFKQKHMNLNGRFKGRVATEKWKKWFFWISWVVISVETVQQAVKTFGFVLKFSLRRECFNLQYLETFSLFVIFLCCNSKKDSLLLLQKVYLQQPVCNLTKNTSSLHNHTIVIITIVVHFLRVFRHFINPFVEIIRCHSVSRNNASCPCSVLPISSALKSITFFSLLSLFPFFSWSFKNFKIMNQNLLQ